MQRLVNLTNKNALNRYIFAAKKTRYCAKVSQTTVFCKKNAIFCILSDFRKFCPIIHCVYEKNNVPLQRFLNREGFVMINQERNEMKNSLRHILCTGMLLLSFGLRAAPIDSLLANFDNRPTLANADAFFGYLYEQEFTDEPRMYSKSTAEQIARFEAEFKLGEFEQENSRLKHKDKIYAIMAVIIILLLTAGIIFTVRMIRKQRTSMDTQLNKLMAEISRFKEKEMEKETVEPSKLPRERVLTISGSGAMADYGYDNPGWFDLVSQIKTVPV